METTTEPDHAGSARVTAAKVAKVLLWVVYVWLLVNLVLLVLAFILLLLGAGLLLLALRQWRSRPAPGEQAALPKWMSAIDTMTAGKGFGLGFLLAAVNPKNLLMGAGAGLVIGSADLDTGDTVVAIVVFTVLAACSVAIPVIASGGIASLDDLRALRAAASSGQNAEVRRRWNLDVLVPLAALIVWAGIAVAVTR